MAPREYKLTVDRTQALQSLPARFGEPAGRMLPVALHVAMLTLLALAGAMAGVGTLYYLGVAVAAGLILYEERLLKLAANVFVLNERVFAANMLFSVLFLVTTALSYARLSR